MSTTIVQPCPESSTDLASRFAISADLRKAQKKALQDEAASILARILVDNPQLTSIVVQAYTPGFNDGDPCTHQQCTPYLNGYDDDGCGHTQFSPGDESLEELDYCEARSRWTELGGPNVAPTIDGMSDLLADAFDTNWAIRVRRLSNGEIGFDQTDYDCGY